MRAADLNGCRLKFSIVVYEATVPHRTTFQMLIFDRPKNRPDLKIEMNDWDDLLYYADQLFTQYNVKYPLPVITYDKDYKLKTV